MATNTFVEEVTFMRILVITVMQKLFLALLLVALMRKYQTGAWKHNWNRIQNTHQLFARAFSSKQCVLKPHKACA